MGRVKPNGETEHGHIYLYCKGIYRVDMSRVKALSRILSEIYLLDPEYVSERDVMYHMLNIALDHKCDKESVIEIMTLVNPANKFEYDLFKYTSYADAVIGQCMSIISRLKTADIPGKLPNKDINKFFKQHEIIKQVTPT